MIDTQPHRMANDTYAPMISCLDIHHEYQANHLYKQIIQDTDTNSSKILLIILGEGGLEITFQIHYTTKKKS